ncbi:ParB partition protein [Pseudomonas veronii 1YdBTEX2]|uniref:ParB partition protein n=1 Tax=Pseudomonas veronii 1YdBTEX2 TaxID=1295141 RepID=A0A1D3K7D7_PSEVE|nr:ParB partition protein [Pseudomonas veronii 1YdBTEX2]
MARDLSRLKGLSSVNALTEGAQQGTVLELDPSQIRVEKQVRKKFRNIEELARSMKEEQQSPIIVSPLDKNTNTYLLQKGERRLRAAILNGEGFKIKAIVDPTVRSKSKSTASQLAENIQREPLTPIEVAIALVDLREQMKEEGKKGTGRELADYCNKPESWVSKHLALADLPDELAALIDDEITSDSELIQSLAKICELKPDLYLQLIDQARSDGGLSRSEARDHLKAARGGSAPKSQPITPTVTPQPQPQGQGQGLPSTTVQNGSNVDPGGAGQGGTQKSGPDQKGACEEDLATDTNGVASPQPILHADNSGSVSGAGHAESTTPTPTTRQQPKKLGKTDVLEIPPEQMVMQVRVSTDKKQFTGELLLNVICGNPNKGMVSYLDGSKQQRGLFDLDQIEIITLAQLASGD